LRFSFLLDFFILVSLKPSIKRDRLICVIVAGIAATGTDSARALVADYTENFISLIEFYKKKFYLKTFN